MGNKFKEEWYTVEICGLLDCATRSTSARARDLMLAVGAAEERGVLWVVLRSVRPERSCRCVDCI